MASVIDVVRRPARSIRVQHKPTPYAWINKDGGPVGPGVPEGGTPGQVLVKSGSNDYETEWAQAQASVSVGLSAIPAAGPVEVPVHSGWTYEIAAQANASVTLVGEPGYQVALVVEANGYDVSIEGEVVGTQTYVAHLTTSGWTLYPVTRSGDTVAPTAGTLNAFPTTSDVLLTVTGAMDDVALHQSPYQFTIDGGATWTAWQESNSYQYEGLDDDTSYTFQHRVRDAAGNMQAGSAVGVTTPALPVWTPVFSEDFTAADNTFVVGKTTTTGGLTWSGPLEEQTNGGSKIVGNRLYWDVHSKKADAFVSVPASQDRHRLSGTYEIDKVGASRGQVSFGFTTNSAGTNYILFELMVDTDGEAGTLTFTDYAAGDWTMDAEVATGHPLTGEFSMTFDPAGSTGTLVLNATQVATFSGDANVSCYGAFVRLSDNSSALDNLLFETST